MPEAASDEDIDLATLLAYSAAVPADALPELPFAVDPDADDPLGPPAAGPLAPLTETPGPLTVDAEAAAAPYTG